MNGGLGGWTLHEQIEAAAAWHVDPKTATAIADEVDFVLLSGNLLDVDLTGPRGMIFLIEQFERLRQRRIEVYWAAGEVDAAERRSASFRIPDNVRIFSSLRPEEITVSRDGLNTRSSLGSTTVPGRSARAWVRSRACVFSSRISMRRSNTRTSTRLPMGAGRAA